MIELLNMDCMDYLKECDDNAFQLCIADPPYGIGDTFINSSSGEKKMKLERIHKPIKWDDNIPSDNYFKELCRVSKKQVIWGANYFNCFDGGALVWYKNRGGNTLSQCEIASVSGQKKVDYVAIQILTGFTADETRIHPTQKPVKLYEWLLTNYAKEGDRILDTHGGSMSSAIACHNLNYDMTIIELDEDYFKAGKERLEAHQQQLRFSM
ncbi:MAG: site-specific DNA-methyltransferase [Gammaproteobacteria bacterium]|nr:site-specific DNA-methyltransferase [Gammaproteobacteria bacterium]